jgi:hypothetical protein
MKISISSVVIMACIFFSSQSVAGDAVQYTIIGGVAYPIVQAEDNSVGHAVTHPTVKKVVVSSNIGVNCKKCGTFSMDTSKHISVYSEMQNPYDTALRAGAIVAKVIVGSIIADAIARSGSDDHSTTTNETDNSDVTGAVTTTTNNDNRTSTKPAGVTNIVTPTGGSTYGGKP